MRGWLTTNETLPSGFAAFQVFHRSMINWQREKDTTESKSSSVEFTPNTTRVPLKHMYKQAHNMNVLSEASPV